jgi:hypothetical protein
LKGLRSSFLRAKRGAQEARVGGRERAFGIPTLSHRDPTARTRVNGVTRFEALELHEKCRGKLRLGARGGWMIDGGPNNDSV